MVAWHEKYAVGTTQGPEKTRDGFMELDTARHDIAGDDGQVDGNGSNAFEPVSHLGRRRKSAQMDIGNMGDPISFEGRG